MTSTYVVREYQELGRWRSGNPLSRKVSFTKEWFVVLKVRSSSLYIIGLQDLDDLEMTKEEKEEEKTKEV